MRAQARKRLPHKGQLAKLLVEQFSLAGFDHKEATDIPLITERWPRPPFVTDLDLGGEPLMPYLIVPTLKVDELVNVYEQFIAGYLYSRRLHNFHPDRWLRANLKLQHYEAKRFFSRPRPSFNEKLLNLHLNLVQFAGLVLQNVENCTVIEGHNTFLVTANSRNSRVSQFGVLDGQFVSNLKCQRRIPVRFLCSPDGKLSHLAQSFGAEASEKPGLYDQLALWLRSQVGPRSEALKIGLLALRWSKPEGAQGHILDLGRYEHSHNVLLFSKVWAREVLQQVRETSTPGGQEHACGQL